MRSLPIFAALAAFSISAHADSLDAIFGRMDRAAKEFKSVSATMHQDDYTAVLNESSREDGELWWKRTKNALRGKVEFRGQDARTVLFHGNLLDIYLPKAKQLETYDISKYASPSMVDEMILLSFGAASGAEIRKTYDVALAGTENIDSRPVSRVELTPKADSLKKQIARITLWIPEGETRAVKEKVDRPSKDYILWTYSDVKVNVNIPDSDLDLKLPPGVKRIEVK